MKHIEALSLAAGSAVGAAWLAAVITYTAHAQEGKQDPKALTVQALNAEANARECQAQLLRVQARMTDGSLAERTAFVKEFEAANPESTLDASLKIIAKPKSTK